MAQTAWRAAAPSAGAGGAMSSIARTEDRRTRSVTRMGLLSLEHGKLAYRADFVIYGAAMAVMALALLVAGPRGHGLGLAACAVAGFFAWSAIEYLLHRFVLHGVQPFRRWHALHHERPTALIGTPTIATALLFATFAFLPALLLGGLWNACALTLGLLAGYQAYCLAHHAAHHWRADFAWMRLMKRRHASHHHAAQACCFGVGSSFWDRVFGTLPMSTAPDSRHASATHPPASPHRRCWRQG
jgi:sterol desaturase/sphingolipid hydroxylase (fatty acid hydroxylase superfamily)